MCLLLLGWYGLPPFLCGPAYLSANFICARLLGGIHFAKRFGQLFRIGRPTLPVGFGCFGPWSTLFPANPTCALLLFILGLFVIEVGDLTTPIIIPRIKFPELIQDFPDLAIDNGFDFGGIGFAGYLRAKQVAEL